ncbi:hypothetical protein [Undibacterium sp. CCC3.4]|uniref:hypothetical protein n=1 Tax=Undibacterium sp. CCC3.4 TaxID=3048609 RepID=UPI002AC9583E|nr:hypothetical protein [Undibacterium sp. CCC3.4]WPX42990.1 hypothetical protein RHM61_16640 [Undibacterium sp. CCC3.4]
MLWLLTALCSAPAAATTDLVLQLETSLSRDSNPLRFYTDQLDAAQNALARPAATVAAADLRLAAIVPLLSDQTRLILSATLGERHYNAYRQLDHQPHAGDAAFEWVASKLLSGRVSVGAAERLFPYLNGSLTDKDLEHEQHVDASLNLHISDDWLLATKWYRSSLSYDLNVNRLYDFRESGEQLGLRYLTGTGSSIEAGNRWARTDYPDRNAQQINDLDRQYHENELFLDGEWRYSVKTNSSVHLGTIRRAYQSLNERNTHLFNAIWRGTYLYSPKLRLDVQLFDRPFSIVDPSVLYVQSKGARFDALWKTSEKLQFNLSALRQNSTQTLIPRLATAANSGALSENLQRLGLGASYQFERGFRLLLDGFHEKTSGDAANLNLSQNIVKVGFEYTFENQSGAAGRAGINRYQRGLSAPEALRP